MKSRVDSSFFEFIQTYLLILSAAFFVMYVVSSFVSIAFFTMAWLCLGFYWLMWEWAREHRGEKR